MARLTVLMMVLATGLTAVADDKAAEETNKAADGLHPRVKFETTLGDITLELDGEKAPISTMNFVQYVQDKYYDGTIFHRVIDNFMIQGGGFTTEGQKTEGQRAAIKNEWQNGLKNDRGTISMARTQVPDSATSQFFINVVDNTMLDQPRGGAAYAVFGKVVEGMETVDAIKATPVQNHATIPGGKVPVEPVIIKAATLIGEFDKAACGKAVAEAEAKAKAEKAARKAKLADEWFARAGEEFKVFVKQKEEETGKKATITETYLAYIDMTVGAGPMPPAGARVSVHYTGMLKDGTKFDSSVDKGRPFEFSLSGGVIAGWLEGVATMNVGTKRKLLIPSYLGYGERGSGARIPPNSTLVFDVELLGIK